VERQRGTSTMTPASRVLWRGVADRRRGATRCWCATPTAISSAVASRRDFRRHRWPQRNCALEWSLEKFAAIARWLPLTFTAPNDRLRRPALRAGYGINTQRYDGGEGVSCRRCCFIAQQQPKTRCCCSCLIAGLAAEWTRRTVFLKYL
jgi:hypothetical protein